jgi:hypothetical protein
VLTCTHMSNAVLSVLASTPPIASALVSTYLS